jgi:hypothetical protein
MRLMPLALLLVPALVACTKGDAPSDTAASVVPASDTAAATPRALTAADVSGNWNGTTMTATGDSVLGRWTSVRSSDSTGKLVFEGTRDSVPFRTRFDGDSMVSTSDPYTARGAARGAPKVMFRSAGRLRDGKLVGTSATMLASKPDSVINRTRWEATRAP